MNHAVESMPATGVKMRQQAGHGGTAAQNLKAPNSTKSFPLRRLQSLVKWWLM